MKADLSESTKDFEDEFVERLQKSVKHVKESREMEKRFMLFEEMLRDERKEGRAEGQALAVVSILKGKGEVSDDLKDCVMNEKDVSILEKWVLLAAEVKSVEEFLKEM